MKVKVTNSNYSGRIQVPPSKSDSQRAILASALQRGTIQLIGLGNSADERSMLQNIERLGAKIKAEESGEFTIIGIQDFPKEAELNVGESGLGVRLITSVCAAFEGIFSIQGEGSLLSRPQGFFEDHLTQLGVRVKSDHGKLPLLVQGKMQGGRLEIDGSVSSQFLSGLLMALPLVKEDTELIVNNLRSIPYVRMTLDTLKRFGIDIENQNFERFYIRGGQTYSCEKYQIEGDWSSASYWLVAAALGAEIQISGLNLESYQADIALLDALVMADCVVMSDEQGITVDGNYRKVFSFDATHCPDLFPALVAFAAFCDGDTLLFGANRLRYKESDRAQALKEEFAKLGLAISIDDDLMIVHGGVKLRSAMVNAHGDHRMAMCLAIAGMFIDGGIEIEGAEHVAKSYPGFWDDLNSLIQ